MLRHVAFRQPVPAPTKAADMVECLQTYQPGPKSFCESLRLENGFVWSGEHAYPLSVVARITPEPAKAPKKVSPKAKPIPAPKVALRRRAS